MKSKEATKILPISSGSVPAIGNVFGMVPAYITYAGFLLRCCLSVLDLELGGESLSCMGNYMRELDGGGGEGQIRYFLLICGYVLHSLSRAA